MIWLSCSKSGNRWWRSQNVTKRRLKVFLTKVDNFQVGDWVLKWDAAKQDKGKHGKFDSLWIGPFVIDQVQQNNTFKLKNIEGEEVFDGPFNGQFLKLYFI